LKHFASPGFWQHDRPLPENIQRLADKNFELLKRDPRHPSLRLKRVGLVWSARVGLEHRAVAKERAEGLIWIWIGRHDAYAEFIK
jgi:hypothetical protein